MSSTLRAALHADVALQTTGFILAEDLDSLDLLRGHRAAVAVILYAARILEALAGRALEQTNLAPADRHEMPKLHHILAQLRDYGHLPPDTYQLLDRLRELGNITRHLRRHVNNADADQGYALALRAVHWYFCVFSRGPQLKALTRHDRPLDDLLPHEAADLLQLLQSDALDGRGFVQTLKLNQPNCPLLVSPVLAAVLVEKLLDRKRHDEAETVLSAALARMPDDVRLRQLRGLLYSRTGRPAQACECLEAIGSTDSAADEETLGLLAGAYKRRAEAGPGQREHWQRRSQRGYAEGWRRSGEMNTYLGINAAALGLWLGEPGYESVARSVRDALAARKKRLSPQPLTLWDELSLAEAYLLERDWEAARAGYADAARLYPHESGALEVARAQAEKHLRALGRPDLIGWMFGGSG